jgi:hypothetical protein
VLEENVLRQRTTQDIATNGGSFDIIFIGAYETPIWGANGWLTPLDDFGDDPDYDLEDIFQLVRNGLSADGTSTRCRSIPRPRSPSTAPTCSRPASTRRPSRSPMTEFEEMVGEAARSGQRRLRHLPARQGRLGREHGLRRPARERLRRPLVRHGLEPDRSTARRVERNAITYYVDLMTNYGPPGATGNGHNENRALFKDGKCATWVDATSAANDVKNPANSRSPT